MPPVLAPEPASAMGALIRARDWSATPLGTSADWSQPLRTALDICLGSSLPTFVWWGPQLISLHNDAAQTALGPAHGALGRPARETWPDGWPAVMPVVEQAERGGGSLAGGGVTVSCAAIRDEAGALGGVFVTLVELRGSARDRHDRILASLAHELRTPLSAIVLWSKMLRTGTLDVPTSLEAVDTILRSAQAQNRLINGLLELNRLSSGRQALLAVPVDPDTAFREATRTCGSLAETRGIALEVHLAAGGAALLGDPTRVRQVAANLIDEAVELTPPGGRVIVRSLAAGEAIELEVAVAGPAVDAQVVAHLLDPLGVDPPLRRGPESLRLGVAIARQVVQLHGGTLGVWPGGDGQGPRFVARFPRRVDRAGP